MQEAHLVHCRDADPIVPAFWPCLLEETMRLSLFTAGCLIVAIALTVSGPTSGAPDPNVAPSDPRSPEDERKCFHLPPGFEIELVAAEPEVRKPINLNFDDHGRLWVTESTEYPFPVEGDRKGKDCVKVLELNGKDGKASRVTTFATELNIPIGVLPVTRGAIVHSIPNIWRLSDTKDKGRADKREVLFGTYGHKDTHGMTGSFTWGFDGWVYACHGFANSSTVRAADGSEITMTSGNTYRMRPDGSRIEQFTWGQVNPFGLAFDPLGNLYSADCHSRPMMQLLRGGYYPSFGKPHDGLGFAPEMMTHDHGSTAICGLAYYAADQFPRAWHDTVFIGNVMTNRINHDKLERHGATYKAIQQPDFLSCDDQWFRPVDIKLGPDGALYVADFYNRIIGHYEVPLTHPGRDRERGRIWRIWYRGDRKERPTSPREDWAKATVPELIADLGHPNMVVRTIATNQLVERGGAEGVTALREALRPDTKPAQRMHALWALERVGGLDKWALDTACHDKDPAVRVHAMRVLSERKELSPEQRQRATEGLKDSDAFVQRAAADALGRNPAAASIRPLLDLRHAVPAADTHLLHVVRMALRDQLRAGDRWQKLPQPLSDADARAIADVATGVPSAESAAYLVHHVQNREEPLSRLTRYVHHGARYGAADQTPKLLAFARKDRAQDLKHQAALFRSFTQGTQERGAQPSDDARRWGEELIVKLLAAKENDVLQLGIDLAGAQKYTGAEVRLAELAGMSDLSEPARRAAVTALIAVSGGKQLPVMVRVLTDANAPPGLRDHVATALAGLNQAETRTELVKALPTAPARLQSAIAAGLAGSPQGAEQLLEAVAAGKASARLLLERPVEVRLSQSKLPKLKERVAKLTAGLPAVDQKLQELLKRRRDGYARAKPDVELGAKVFEKNCANCHQIANKGAKIGPQLDGIGARGLERLLEDTIDPNRNVDQAFRSTSLGLKNGQFVSGLVLREEGEVIILADNQGKEVRVAKDQVEEKTVSQLSPMPANLADQIPEADFYHLVAFLLSQRVAPKAE